jgi:hypothetical protein
MPIYDPQLLARALQSGGPGAAQQSQASPGMSYMDAANAQNQYGMQAYGGQLAADSANNALMQQGLMMAGKYGLRSALTPSVAPGATAAALGPAAYPAADAFGAPGVAAGTVDIAGTAGDAAAAAAAAAAADSAAAYGGMSLADMLAAGLIAM